MLILTVAVTPPEPPLLLELDEELEDELLELEDELLELEDELLELEDELLELEEELLELEELLLPPPKTTSTQLKNRS